MQNLMGAFFFLNSVYSFCDQKKGKSHATVTYVMTIRYNFRELLNTMMSSTILNALSVNTCESVLSGCAFFGAHPRCDYVKL